MFTPSLCLDLIHFVGMVGGLGQHVGVPSSVHSSARSVDSDHDTWMTTNQAVCGGGRVMSMRRPLKS